MHFVKHSSYGKMLQTELRGTKNSILQATSQSSLNDGLVLRKEFNVKSTRRQLWITFWGTIMYKWDLFLSIKRQITRSNKNRLRTVTYLLLLLQNTTTHTIDLTWTQRRSCHLAEMQRSIQFPFQPHGAPIPYDRRKPQNISTYNIHKQITSKLTEIQRKKICKQWICHSKKA
jgi:hypothetical protein